jgi:hypothetical protein
MDGRRSIESVRLVIPIFSGYGRFAYFSCPTYFGNAGAWTVLNPEASVNSLSFARPQGERGA